MGIILKRPGNLVGISSLKWGIDFAGLKAGDNEQKTEQLRDVSMSCESGVK